MKRSFFTPLMVCLLLIGMMGSGCEPSLSDVDTPPSMGQADFSRLMMVGDDYMAGFADEGWSRPKQMQSVSNLLAGQLAMLASDAASFNNVALAEGVQGSGNWQLQGVSYDTCGFFGAQLQWSEGLANWDEFMSAEGTIHNFSVPKLLVDHLDQTPAIYFPYEGAYVNRFLGTESTTIMEKMQTSVQEVDPSFVLLWLGMQDVMEYCWSGGGNLVRSVSNETDPDLRPIGLTSSSDFRNKYKALVETLFAGETRQGALVNVPNVLEMPYFTYFNNLHTALDTAVMDSLRFRDACQGMHLVWIESDSNGDGVMDAVVAKKGDLVLLSAASLIGEPNEAGVRYGLDPAYPLADHHVLELKEKSAYDKALRTINQVISAAAEDHNLLLIDMHTFFEELAGGQVSFEGLRVNSSYVNGNFFGVDGYSPTIKANAMLSNEIIDALNVFYAANIPKVDIRNYSGIVYP